jgi:hypothetical protein
MADTPREEQQSFDYPRVSQLAILRDCNLTFRKTKDGIRVSPLAQKAVLRVIDDHGRGRTCFLSFKTLASEAGMGIRQTKRAVEVLHDASLIIVETKASPYGVVCNHYTIVWTELDQLRRDDRLPVIADAERRSNQSAASGTPLPLEQSDLETDQSAFETARSDLETDQSAFTTHKALPKRFEAQGTAPSSCDREAAADPDGSAWATVRERLLSLGVYAVLIDELIAALAARGATPIDASTLAEHFAARREEFGAGALANALKHWAPGQAYDAPGLWPAATARTTPSGKWRL